MPQALIAVAEWIGTAIFASLPESVPIVVAATIADVVTVAALAIEVAAIAEVTSILSPKIGGNFGTQVDFKADPQAGIPYAVGRTAVAGNIVFTQSAGAKSKYLNYVAVYTGAGPIDSFESFLVNGVAVPFTADGGEGAAGYYANRMWRKSQLGASPEAGYLHWTSTATGETPANHAGMPAEWTSAHQLSGFAADLWALGFNTDKYAAGTPKRLTVGKWVKAYDPRLDSTYPGGSGAQRLADESTWAWTANPYLHALTWLIGRYQNGKRILGVGLPAAAIDFPAYVHGANVADANAWTCGGVAYSTDDKYEVLKAFLQAGGGKPMRLGAKMSCLVSAPRTSLATIRSADVVGDPSIAGGITRRGRINTIWPKYREEAQAWQQVTLDNPVSVATYITEDGGIRSRAVEYPLVQGAKQAAQLAYYDIANSREFTPVTLPCKPVWMGYQPGDCITADEPEWGLNSQKLLIVKRQRDPMTMQVTLTLASETDAKHTAALALDAVGPSTPGLTGIDPNLVAQPGVGVFTATGGDVAGVNGTNPALIVTGTSDNVNATDILIRYRLHAGPGDWIGWPAVHAGSVGDAVRIEITGVADGTQYDVQIAYRSGRGAASAWTDLGAVTAGDLSIDGVGDGTPPANVSAPPTLTVEQGHDAAGVPFSFLNITWPANTEPDLDGYVVEIGDGTGTVDFFAGSASFQVRGLVAGATYSARVKAVDKSGNVSAGWTTVTTQVITGIGEGANLVPNGGLTLGTTGWQSASNWGWGTDGIVGYFFECLTNGTNLAESAEFAAVVGKAYTFSLFGGTALVPTAGDVYMDIEWFTAAHAHLSYSARIPLVHLAAGADYQLHTLTVTAPATAAFARARIYTESITFHAGGFSVITQVKVEQGSAFTGFNDLATTGAIYADGTDINSLKPLDVGATKNTVFRSSTTPTALSTGDFWVVLSGGVPIALKQWNGTAWVTPADLTSNNTAAAITGQQAWATAKVSYQTTAPSSPTLGDVWIDTSTTPVKMKRYDGSSFVLVAQATTNTNQITDGSNLGGTAAWSGVTGSGKPADNADVTSTHTAAGFTGQGTLASSNFYYQSSDPGSVANGSLWADTSGTPTVLKQRISGAWQTVANNASASSTYVTVNADSVSNSSSTDGTVTTPSVTATFHGATGTVTWEVLGGGGTALISATNPSPSAGTTAVSAFSGNVTTAHNDLEAQFTFQGHDSGTGETRSASCQAAVFKSV